MKLHHHEKLGINFTYFPEMFQFKREILEK